MFEELLQYIADKVIIKLNETIDNDEFNFYYQFGLSLNNLSINYFDFYLK